MPPCQMQLMDTAVPRMCTVLLETLPVFSSSRKARAIFIRTALVGVQTLPPRSLCVIVYLRTQAPSHDWDLNAELAPDLGPVVHVFAIGGMFDPREERTIDQHVDEVIVSEQVPRTHAAVQVVRFSIKIALDTAAHRGSSAHGA